MSSDPVRQPEQQLGADDESVTTEAADSALPLAPDEAAAVQGPADQSPTQAEDGLEQPPDVDELDPLAEARRQRDEYLDHLRRERAEFENFRKRATRERMDALDRGAEQVLASLLHVLDTFGFALAAAQDHPEDQLAKGVEMVHAELMSTLKASGLEEIEGVGEHFDPTHHEAMMQIEAHPPIDEPTVVEVLRPGYRFKGRVLRPASVKVAK